MSFRRVFVSFLAALALLLLAAPSAFAQSITVINPTSLPRLDKNGKQVTKRANLNPEGVSLQDCVDDQQISFPLQLQFETSSSIQLWASTGNNCVDQTSRSGATSVCWKLGANVPLQAATTVNIPVREILSGAVTPQTPDKTANICGKVDLTTISVNLLYFPPGQPNTPTAGGTAVAITADTVGPDPPSGLSILPGNTRLKVSWTAISGGDGDGGSSAGVVALTGIKIYCDSVSTAPTTVTVDASCTEAGTVTNPDAGDGGDSGIETTLECTDGGTETVAGSNDCASKNFVNADGTPKLPDNAFNGLYECGSATGNTVTSVTATAVGGKALVNGTRYAVGVAATDAYGNVGPLSAVQCGVPEETTDFWTEYKQAGGKAGGCDTTPNELPLGTFTTAAITGTVLTLSTLRRRRRNRK